MLNYIAANVLLVGIFYDGVNCGILKGLLDKIVPLRSLKPFAKIDQDSITVSGFSSGGAMSTMLHHMYSSKFKGMGMFAGGKI